MIRRIFPLALLLAGIAAPLSAGDDASRLAAEAGALYRKAQYGAAIAVYDSLARMGYADARLYYNLGNARFKRGELALGRLWYERALRLDPGDADTRRNIDIISSRLADRVEPVPQLFLIRWWIDCRDGATAKGLFLAGAALFAGVLCIAVVYAWWPLLWLRRLSFIAGSALAALWLLSLALFFDRLSDDASRSEAVIMAGSVTAKSSPDRSGVDAFTIHEGLKVEIRDTYDQWRKIRLPDGKLGWIPAGALERI